MARLCVKQLSKDLDIFKRLQELQLGSDFLLAVKDKVAHVAHSEVVRDEVVEIAAAGNDYLLFASHLQLLQ